MTDPEFIQILRISDEPSHLYAADRIAKLSPANQLRLAADLIEQGRPDTGETLVRHVAATLAAHRLIAAAKGAHD